MREEGEKNEEEMKASRRNPFVAAIGDSSEQLMSSRSLLTPESTTQGTRSKPGLVKQGKARQGRSAKISESRPV